MGHLCGLAIGSDRSATEGNRAAARGKAVMKEEHSSKAGAPPSRRVVALGSCQFQRIAPC